MDTGPQSEPKIVEPLEDPFKRRREAPVPARPVRQPEKVPAAP